MNEALIDSFTQAALNTATPWFRDRLGEAALRAALRSECESHMMRRGDLPFAAGFRKACPAPAATVSDYLNKLLPLPSGGHVLAGMRFKGLDLGQPYVALLGSDRPLTDPDVFKGASEAAREAYAVFKPTRVRLRAPEGWSMPGAEADLIVMGATIEDVQARPFPKRRDRIVLKRATDLSFYPRYRRVHDAFRDSSPFGIEVSPSTEDELASCLEEGLVFEAFVKGQWAGLMACAPGSEDGMVGVCVYEEILSSEFRGQGLAAAMQRHMIDALDGSNGDWIFGTIHADNGPSLATARRVGRGEVWRYMFVG